MAITFRKIENKDEWEGLFAKVSFKTFFHSLNWENFLEDEFSNIKFERYAWKDELILSMARAKFLGREKLVSHPFCEYGGPLPLKEKANFENFVEDFKSEFGNRAKVKFHPYLASNPSEGNTNAVDFGLLSFWLENFSKKSPDDLFKSFRKTLQQEIRKFEESGIEVHECDNAKDLNDFYGLYLKTMKRHKNIPLPFSAFAFFYREDGAKIFLAHKDKRVVGGSVFLFYKPFIHYFINSSDANFRGSNIGHGILWHAMRSFANLARRSPGGEMGGQYDFFDLGGTRKGSPLEVFKRGWGAKEVSIYEIGATGKGGGKSLLRNVWAMLPDSAVRRLSPFFLWMKL